jgi:hypothetical protein
MLLPLRWMFYTSGGGPPGGALLAREFNRAVAHIDCAYSRAGVAHAISSGVHTGESRASIVRDSGGVVVGVSVSQVLIDD